MIRLLKVFVCFGIFLSATGLSWGETSDNRIAAETDWSVFVEKNPTRCWAVSAPKQVTNSKNGRPVDVRRGNILLFVSYWAEKGKQGEVSFIGGYPFAEGSTVTLNVSGTKFELFTLPKGETAWAASSADDAKIIAMMKRGANAVLNGRSGRGTKTKDTFSLLGFTAAVEEAEKRCSG